MFPDALVTGLALLLDLAVAGLVLWAVLVVIKLPALLERQAAAQMQSQQVLRELLAEIRKVTRE